MKLINIVKESDQLYHVFIGDKDMWLSRLDLIELRRTINSLAL